MFIKIQRMSVKTEQTVNYQRSEPHMGRLLSLWDRIEQKRKKACACWGKCIKYARSLWLSQFPLTSFIAILLPPSFFNRLARLDVLDNIHLDHLRRTLD
jgi:hypothetical protein